MLDADHLLKPIRDGNACGDALDYDLSFLELEIASHGKPHQQIGDSIATEEAPNWTEVWRLGLDLSARTKDLRVGILLTRSALSQFGFPGLSQGLELLAAYVELYWSELHPRPDPEDDGDQTVRLNALASLCDLSGILAEIRQVPLTASRQFGAFTLRDWAGALRSQSAEVDRSTIELAFTDTDPLHLEQISTGLDASLAAATDLDASVRRHVASDEAVRFDPLIVLLTQAKDLVDVHRKRAQPAAAASPLPDSSKAPYPDVIRNRDDVVEILGRICHWYQVNEPASPLSALLERAQRLVSKDFMALVKELAPEGVAQYRSIAGLAVDEGT
ncbi:hypothetical protein B5K11_28540 [Rhizobium leguminosarum bv. trifolii]|uniref:type VI secretion system protein TssA n=1 Tax=Rhizobium leguminosarum TaxID=384 RepID=UPI000E2ECE3F|nr:type VI secretion system protein TssA [Rhizobium leguminosarum]RFB86574.1 hypothetical protein B5K11_28540 [Rhizobium leguminosarum bv. trifolii]